MILAQSRYAVVFEAGGETYQLHFPLGVLADIQEELGLDSFDKLPELMLGDPKRPSANLKALLVIVANGIKRFDTEANVWTPIDRAAARNIELPLTDLSRIAGEALSLCIAGPKLMEDAKSAVPLATKPTQTKSRPNREQAIGRSSK